jgi:hypothetical protein
VIRRSFAALLAALAVLAGCGGGDDGGSASLWVTRDEGAEVLLVREVPAGITAMQALDREAEVETRYGGRFVQSIDGVEGSLAEGRDWFWFVNGYEADRSAAEYRLRPGDVEWWDFRSWRGRERVPLVVGAFPEPFLHGFAGKRRPTVVGYDRPRLAPLARRLGEIVDAETVSPLASDAGPREANLLVVVAGSSTRFHSWETPPDKAPGDPVVIVVSEAAARRLARDPAAFRFRYEVR